MLEVTRLNGSHFFLNPEMVMTIEETPDTVITLTNDEKLLVKESAKDLVQQFETYKRRIHQQGI